MIFKAHETEWYFSEEGKAAYRQANTISMKLEYIYDYLMSLPDLKETDRNTKFRYTCLIAYCSGISALSFSHHPAILRKEDNPFLGLLFSNCTDLETILQTIDQSFGGKKSGQAAAKSPKHPFTSPANVLDFPKNGEFSDKYAVQRLAIWLFTNKEKEKQIGFYPYLYKEKDKQ